MELIPSLQSGLDDYKPSLFELLSEQQLSSLIPPSLRYLLVVTTQRYPRYLLRILNSFDELYALGMVAVERHYLKTYGGSFVENFYGLKRERVLRVKGGELPRTQLIAPTPLREASKLSNGDVWKNIAVIVGLPYLKRKLDEAYEIYAPQAILLGPRYNRDTLDSNATIRQRTIYYFKWFLRNIYPSLNAAYYFSTIMFHLAYLFDSTACSSPFLWLIQTRIRRMSAADFRAINLAQQKIPKPQTTALRPGQTNSLLSPRVFNKAVMPKVLSGLRLALPTSIFLLKFLEWWHASDFARQLSRKAAEGLELPPPIIAGLDAKHRPDAKDDAVKNSVSLGAPAGTISSPSTATLIPKPRIKSPTSSISHLPILTVPSPSEATSSLCPICLKDIVTPTAAQTGYVFCYTCIFRWVEGSHERQIAWMEGSGGEEGWGDEAIATDEKDKQKKANREGSWESGKGRCAVTGRRLLGGTDGLRKIIA